MFQSEKLRLADILKAAHEGRIQLPDFQRPYVWGDEDIRSLIASIASGFPFGAMLMLDAGGEVRFKHREIEGAPEPKRTPDLLLLDGQQRTTSLYQACFSPVAVKTRNAKGKEVERHYYLDIAAAVAAPDDLDAAIVGIPANRIEYDPIRRDTVRDLSSREREFEANMFPLDRSFDWTDWHFEWVTWSRANGRDVSDMARRFFQGPVNRIQNYDVPVIRLDRHSSRAAICTIFEKVNVGGKKLDAFELVTAIYAADEFDLREDWLGPHGKHDEGRRARLVGAKGQCDVLKPVSSVDFLKACSLVATRRKRVAVAATTDEGAQRPQVACDRDAVLALKLEDYKLDAGAVEHGFREAAKFLNERRIIWQWDIPYPPQSVALAAVFAALPTKARTFAADEKLDLWFWSAALAELYGMSPDSRLARDMRELIDWIAHAGPPPRTIEEAYFREDRLDSMRSRQSAAYKAVHALLMRRGCRDFISGQTTEIMTFFQNQVDIHHVFPKAWAKRRGIPPRVFNSIVNKTPLFGGTNRFVSGAAPSEYLKRIERERDISADALDAILRTHLIEPELLRADDFEGFMRARKAALGGLVSAAMGGKALVPSAAPAAEREADPDEADDEDADEEIAA